MASTGLVTFVWHGVNGGMFKLKPPTDNKQMATYKRALDANGGSPTIKFRRVGTPVAPKSQFSTSDPDLVKMIRAQKTGRPIAEDLSALPVKCPFPGCEFTIKANTQENQLKLALHFAETHGDVYADDANGDAE